MTLPLLRKGALVGMDGANPLASIIRFQYNPHQLTRTIQPQYTGGGNRGEPQGLRAPRETLSLEIEIDAADQLETGHPLATHLGILPQLSALELLVYPKTLTVVRNAVLLALGVKEIVPPQAPVAVFVWGPKRVLPTRVTDFTITEEQFDADLNPITATVRLTLQVLTYQDLPLTHFGTGMFLAHQVIKEAMAAVGAVNQALGALSS